MKRSKLARLTPRRSACGHKPARQLPKSAAAARIASAVISGWPEAPDWPLHSRVPAAGAGTAAVAGDWSNRVSQLSGLSCATAGISHANGNQRCRGKAKEWRKNCHEWTHDRLAQGRVRPAGAAMDIGYVTAALTSNPLQPDRDRCRSWTGNLLAVIRWTRLQECSNAGLLFACTTI